MDWTIISQHFASYIIAGVLGMLAHFLKMDILGQTPHDIISYFKGNFKTTLLAIIGTLMGVVLAYETKRGIEAAWFAGWLCDSIFTRGPGDTIITSK